MLNKLNKTNYKLRRTFISFITKCLALCMVLTVCAFVSSCGIEEALNKAGLTDFKDKNNPAASGQSDTVIPHTDGKLTVTFIDVGQGDSSFIELPDGKTMLIDAGTSESADKIADFIRSKGYSKIDYVIATHPHADHIGSMREIISSFEIGDIYMPRASTNTKTFEKLLEEISQKGLKIKTAKAGVSICDGIQIIAPCGDEYDDLNNYSAVIKIIYGKNSFLFMGDAEKESENEILQMGYDVSADVIKAGHHGSSTSSSKRFSESVHAKYVVFCVGEGNSYNHPHTEIIERWQSLNAHILRTDRNGNICFVSDGENITFSCEKEI